MQSATALAIPGGIGGGKYSTYYTLFLVSSWVKIFFHCISRPSPSLTVHVSIQVVNKMLSLSMFYALNLQFMPFERIVC